MADKPNNELRYFDALKRIAKDYESAERLLKHADRAYGLDDAEALQMAYENIQGEAANAIRGKRRPISAPTVSAKVKRETARDMKADMRGENGNG